MVNLDDFRITVAWSAEDGAFVARVSGMPGCAADGDTIEEAVREVRVALAGHIEAREARGMDIPEDPAAAQFRQMAPLLNVSELARRAGMKTETLRMKIKRGSRFSADEVDRLNGALAEGGIEVS